MQIEREKREGADEPNAFSRKLTQMPLFNAEQSQEEEEEADNAGSRRAKSCIQSRACSKVAIQLEAKAAQSQEGNGKEVETDRQREERGVDDSNAFNRKHAPMPPFSRRGSRRFECIQ
jgi:hypothetical protein